MARESDLDEKRGLKVACLLLVVRGRNHVLLRSTVFALRLNACSHMSVMVQDVRAAANTKTHICQKMRPRYHSFCCVCFSPKCLHRLKILVKVTAVMIRKNCDSIHFFMISRKFLQGLDHSILKAMHPVAYNIHSSTWPQES